MIYGVGPNLSSDAAQTGDKSGGPSDIAEMMSQSIPTNEGEPKAASTPTSTQVQQRLQEIAKD